MKRLNWIIIKSKDRGTEYGVGTFIKQLSEGLSQQISIEVFVIEIGTDSLSEFTIEKKSEITYFKFPQTNLQKNMFTTANQSKLAKSVVRITLPLLPKERKMVVHLNFVFQCFIGEEFKKAMDCHLIFTQHLFIPQSAGTKNLLDIESRIYSIVDRIITVTNHGKEHLVNKLVDGGKITPVYNGIDPKLFANNTNKTNIRRKYGIGANEKIVLYSGRIDPIKGLRYLSLAFSLLLPKLPDCRLVIAGDGNFDELIRDTKFFSSNINYLGFIPLEDLVVFYKEASIGVIPSLEEHCSYVALEMLHSGLPVVASCLGGLKEIFIHNENAFLVDTITDQTNIYGHAPKVDQLADYMYKLLTDDVLKNKFSHNALIRAKEEFSTDKMVHKYVESITNL
jgi:glycosyltransferase involved in cell wall biosynthesis